MINTFMKTTSVFLMGILLTLSLAGCDTETVNVNDPTLESMVIDGPDEIASGTTAQLNTIATIKVGPETVSEVVNDKVNWASSDAAVATVDAAGLVTSVAEGTTIITSTSKNNDDVTVTHNLRVAPGTLTSIQIERGYNPSVPQVIVTLDVEIATEEYITAWGIYSDGTRRYINTDAFWWSSDQQVASINSFSSSNVFGRDLGSATVTAYFGGLEASIAVTVVSSGPTLESIVIRDGWGSNPPDITGGTIDVEVRDNRPVVAYGNYSDGSFVDINARVAWSSSDLGVAFILDEISSYVYGISVGNATITAEWQGVSAFVNANVIASTDPVLQSIEIQKGYSADGNGEVLNTGNPLVINVGDVQYITAWGIYSDNSKEYINTEVFWLSADQAIASMDLLQRDSNVTGVAAGATEVIARDGVIEGRAPVTVNP